jgi:hypothetical protein
VNPQTLEKLANQKMTEARDAATKHNQGAAGPAVALESLRVRTGWTLVNLGLRLLSQPAATSPQPRPAGS